MTMQGFLSIYDFADWIIRGFAMMAQTLVIGGAAYFLLTLSVLKPGSNERLGLLRVSMRLLFWSALALGFAQLVAAGLLSTFLIGSTNADLATALSATGVLLSLLAAAAAFALAFAARGSSCPSVALLLFLSALVVGAHTGVTHAASRVEMSPTLLAAEMLHLLAIGAWIGGIPYFILSLRRLSARDERWSVARRFSVVSLIAVPIMVATGVLMSFPYVGSLERLYQTNYGLLLGAKVALLAILLCLGAANFLAIRRLRRGASEGLESVSIFGETEVAVGLIAILCAAALASSPLAADTSAARPTSNEIASRFEITTPRLAIPTQPPSVAQNNEGPAGDAVAVSEEAERSPLDIAWSETHHHYAALLVIFTGMVALLSQIGRLTPLTRHWPVLFLGLAVYLFIVADEDAWPLGEIEFFTSLATPRIAQHKLMIAMVAGLSLFEWRGQSRKARAAWPSLAFPVIVAAASAVLLTHYGHTGRKEEVLIEISHMPVALLGVIAASARWLELRLPSSTLKRGAAIIWPVALVAAGVFLLLYRETA
jgi:putative copper resistance protein D